MSTSPLAETYTAPTPVRRNRRQDRIYRRFPIKLKGVDDSGRRFEVRVMADNVSAGGLYAVAECDVREGAWVSVIIWFEGVRASGRPIRLVARGIVVRSERLDGGSRGYAVRFTRHRLV